MKKTLWLCLVVFMVSNLKSQQVTDLLGIAGPIQFNGTEFLLSWSKQNSKSLYYQQFVPSDERREEYHQALNFSFLDKDIDIKDAVRQKIIQTQNLQKKMKSPILNVTESPDGREFIVDYVLDETTDMGNPLFEYHINRFKKAGVQNKALLVLDYTKRYFVDSRTIFKLVLKERNSLMSAMIEYQVPPITLSTETKEAIANKK